MADLLGLAPSTLRSRFAAARVPLFFPSGEELLAVMAAAGVMRPNVSAVSMVKAYDVAKFLGGQGHAEALVNGMHDLARSRPPPVRYRPGTHVPGVPLASAGGGGKAARRLDFASLPFPATLPDVRLSEQEMAERYGLPEAAVPASVAREIKQFCEYSSALVNTERGATYAAPVQQTTLAKHSDRLRAFLGFGLLKLNIAADDLTLDEFLVPASVARYLAYLRARGGTRGYVCNHIALVRKVLNYLQSGSSDDSQIRAHVTKMDAWLGTLETQLAATLPKAPPPELPDSAPVRRWVADTAREALATARAYLDAGIALGKAQAVAVSWGGEAGRRGDAGGRVGRGGPCRRRGPAVYNISSCPGRGGGVATNVATYAIRVATKNPCLPPLTHSTSRARLLGVGAAGGGGWPGDWLALSTHPPGRHQAPSDARRRLPRGLRRPRLSDRGVPRQPPGGGARGRGRRR